MPFSIFSLWLVGSALAHVLLGQLKTAVVMIGASIIFGSEYSPMQLIGATGAVVAIVFYSMVTIQEKNDGRPGLEMNQSLPLVQNKVHNSNSK